jgi:hypothetical protein
MRLDLIDKEFIFGYLNHYISADEDIKETYKKPSTEQFSWRVDVVWFFMKNFLNSKKTFIFGSFCLVFLLCDFIYSLFANL